MQIRYMLAPLVCLGLIAQGASVDTPRPSPEFKIRLTPSGDFSPTQYKGKVVVLACILTTCPHCQAAVGMLSGLQREYGPRGLQVLGVAFHSLAHQLGP